MVNLACDVHSQAADALEVRHTEGSPSMAVLHPRSGRGAPPWISVQGAGAASTGWPAPYRFTGSVSTP
jgi:hypothetical protein